MTLFIHKTIAQHQILQKSLEKNQKDLDSQNEILNEEVKGLQNCLDEFEKRKIEEEINEGKYINPSIIKIKNDQSTGRLELPLNGFQDQINPQIYKSYCNTIDSQIKSHNEELAKLLG